MDSLQYKQFSLSQGRSGHCATFANRSLLTRNRPRRAPLPVWRCRPSRRLTLAVIGISILHPFLKNMTERMKRFAIATMIIALTMIAYSQQGNAQITARTDKEKKADAAIEKAYEDSLKREKSNGPAVKSDPWQTVRPAGGDNTKH
jgi:hypothetical protein